MFTAKPAAGTLGALCLSALLLVACSHDPEFFPLPQFKRQTIVSKDGRSLVHKSEVFVIANPPRDREALRRVVEAFNRRTLSEGDLAAAAQYTREFYRETSSTPRNYQEGNHGYFEHDRIEDHANDLLLFVRWRGGLDSMEYVFFEDGQRVP